MPKCAYCGRENGDAENFCSGCGTSLKAPPTPIPLRTPHRMMGETQQFIWEYFAVKRRRFYLAGLFTGMFGGVLAAMHDPEHGFPLWSLAGGAASGGRCSLVAFVCGETPGSPSPGSRGRKSHLGTAGFVRSFEFDCIDSRCVTSRRRMLILSL